MRKINLKENKIVLGGILAIVFLLLIKTYQKPQEIGLKVHYYRDGIEVNPIRNIFSVVTPPGGVYNSISLEVLGTNIGDTSISNMNIIDASPIAFKNALPISTQTLAVADTSKSLWISGIMSTSQFESMSQPVRFSVNISGVEDYLGKVDYSSGFIDLAITPELIKTFYNTGDDNAKNVWSGYKMAQTFTPMTNHSLLSVNLSLYRAGNLGNVGVQIRTTSGGIPSSTVLSAATTNGNTLPTTPSEWRLINMPPVTLIAGTTYAIVISATGGNSGKSVYWRYDGTSPTYSDGSYVYSSSTGIFTSADVTKDFMFEEVGQ